MRIFMKSYIAIASLFLMTIALAGASGCARRSSAASPRPALEPDRVQVVHPVRRTLKRFIEEPGYVVAIEQTPIYARLPGYVEEVLVDMNALVEKGQVLARLWVPEVENEARQKESQVEQAKAELELARRTLQTAEANLQTATAFVAEVEASRKRVQADRTRWTQEMARMDKLVVKRVIDEQVRDEVRNQLHSAEAACDEVDAKIKSALAAKEESKARLAKAEADVVAARARVSVATADHERMKSLLAYKEIRAPFAGIVTLRNVHTGHLLKPGPAATEPLFVMVRNDRVRVFVEVAEGDAPYILAEAEHGSLASVARLRFQASAIRELDARVSRTSWTLDPTNRTLRVEIELPTAGTGLRPGMYVNIGFLIEHANAWCLPASSILSRDDGAFCYRVENGKALLTPLRIGIRDGSMQEVLHKGKPPAAPARLTVAGHGPAIPAGEDFRGDENIVRTAGAIAGDGQEVGIAR
jgi:HlyD family secretion protein